VSILFFICRIYFVFVIVLPHDDEIKLDINSNLWFNDDNHNENDNDNILIL